MEWTWIVFFIVYGLGAFGFAAFLTDIAEEKGEEITTIELTIGVFLCILWPVVIAYVLIKRLWDMCRGWGDEWGGNRDG